MVTGQDTANAQVGSACQTGGFRCRWRWCGYECAVPLSGVLPVADDCVAGHLQVSVVFGTAAAPSIEIPSILKAA
jgi:hypothetical protein